MYHIFKYEAHHLYKNTNYLVFPLHFIKGLTIYSSFWPITYSQKPI